MSIQNLIESNYRISNENRDDIEIFHVKLTDSALKTIENLSRSKIKPLQLTVEGNHGTLGISGKQSVDYYDFSISPIPNNVDGALDYVQLQGNRVNSIGKPISRITIQANNGSYCAAKLKMNEVEKEQRKGQSKGPVIANGHRSSFRDGSMNPRSVPTPPGSRAADSRISPSLNANRSYSPLCIGSNKSPLNPSMDIVSRPLRDRIIHLLALQSYHRPELILRLKQDGLTVDQRDQVDAIVSKVGRPGRQGEYYLAATFFNMIDPSWPGYSPSEKISATSIKAKWQSSSPTSRLLPVDVTSRVTPQRYSNSPSNPSISAASVDDFGRKPTRAAAPHAPHSITKKIAALDLLASGMPDAAVAAKHGITMTLLGNWRNAEATLRQRHTQRQDGSVAESNIPSQRTSLPEAKGAENSPPVRKEPLPTRVENATGNINRPVKETTAFHYIAKRPRLVEDGNLHDNAKHPSTSCLSSSNRINKRIPRKPASPVIEHHSQGQQPPPEPLETKTTFQQISRPPVASSGFCETVVAGSSCDSAYYTTPTSGGGGGTIPPSSGGSGGGGARSSLETNRVSTTIRRRHPRDCGSETSSCGDSSVPSPETSPPRTVNSDQRGKRRFPPSHRLEEKSLELSDDEECLFSDIASETSELERLFPIIQTANQASSYRKEFEAMYPTYRQLYDSFRDAWNTMDSLKMRVLSAMAVDSRMATKVACELDEFIKGMRAPERREEEMQLAVMTTKLRLLKQRLAVFAETSSAKFSYTKQESQRVPSGFRAFD